MSTSDTNGRPVVVGITGASGAVVAQHTIDALLRESVPVIACASRAARMVWSQEMSESFGVQLWRGGMTQASLRITVRRSWPLPSRAGRFRRWAW